MKNTLAIALLLLSVSGLAMPPSGVRTQPVAGTVALTFDDGPSRRYTPKILRILKQHHVRAVFFVIARLAKKIQTFCAKLLLTVTLLLTTVFPIRA